MSITIQELHKYNSLVELKAVPAIECPLDSEHMRTIPWEDENGRVYQRCLACESKLFLSQSAIDTIKLLINKKNN